MPRARRAAKEVAQPKRRRAVPASGGSTAISPRRPKDPGRHVRRAPGERLRIDLLLSFTPPLDWDSLVSFIGLRAIPGVESVEEGAYRRTVRFGRREGTLRISRDGDRALRLVVDRRLRPDLDEIVRRARRLFDLDADPKRIARHLGRDRSLAPIVRRLPGLRVPGAFDGFETSVRAILGQQVSVKGATTLSGRLVASFGRPMAGGAGALTHHFPEPVALAGAELTRIGLPAARAGAIRALALAVRDDAISLDAAPDLDAWIGAMCELPGVGPWTASYVAMRALGDPDAIPLGDLGLRRALGLSPKALEARSEAWRPWRAYAAMYLWKGPRSGPVESKR